MDSFDLLVIGGGINGVAIARVLVVPASMTRMVSAIR